MMKILLVALVIFLTSEFSYADSTTPKPLVTQTIVYKTSKATEMYLVWAMDNWKVPDKKYQLPGTYINNGMAYTKMNGQKDSFSIRLQLPPKIYVDFMFLASKDTQGKAVELWDNNWGANYNIYVDKKNEAKFPDDKLYTAEKNEPKYNLLEKGWTILTGGAILCLFAIGYFLMRRRKLLVQKLSLNTFLIGFILSTILLLFVIRLQMNEYLDHKQYLLFGLAFSDILFILMLSLIIFFFLYGTNKFPILYSIVQFIAFLFVFLTVLFSIINIEIVKQLGKPINVNWLYYSDFLKGTDAINALKSNFTTTLSMNLIYILTGVLLGAFAIALAIKASMYSLKKVLVLSTAFCLAILLTGYLQVRTNKFNRNKTENPVSALAISWIGGLQQPDLFSMKVEHWAKDSIENMHAWHNENVTKSNGIKNIIVFVLESTPASLVQIYDSTYKVTPNLNEWKKYAKIFTNMRSHFPGTVNSLFSIISGLYPMINYKTIVGEHPNFNNPSLITLLNENGWKSSLFFSSDLSYNKMGEFIKSQNVAVAEDMKTINCDSKKLQSGYAQLDGLNDHCIVDRYFNYTDSTKAHKNFSILWSNQTHYPYFVSKQEKSLVPNPLLNTYLNALSEVDEAFGKLMAELKVRNMVNNTLVIVIGDHGEAFGTHNQYSHGSKIYDENIHIPCLLINPMLFNGEYDDRICGTIDVGPTIAHIAGQQKLKDAQGIHLLSTQPRSHNFSIGTLSDYLFSTQTAEWKYIYNATTNENELYNLKTDPKELTNVAGENPLIVKKEYQLLAAWAQYHNKKINQLITSQ